MVAAHPRADHQELGRAHGVEPGLLGHPELDARADHGREFAQLWCRGHRDHLDIGAQLDEGVDDRESDIVEPDDDDPEPRPVGVPARERGEPLRGGFGAQRLTHSR